MKRAKRKKPRAEARGSLLNKGGFTARSVTPQGRYAGYSGRIGFTLIELLVVILIIGILATVALPQYQKAVVKSKYASMKTLVNTLYQAEKTYFLEHGNYSDNFDQLDLNVGQKVGIRIRSFPFGTCQMSVGSYIFCKSTTPPISYLQFFSGERSCVAYGNNPLSKRICIEETNNTPAPDSYRAANGWYRYP